MPGLYMDELIECLWNNQIIFQSFVSTLYLRIPTSSAHHLYCSIKFLRIEGEFTYNEIYSSSVYTLMSFDRFIYSVLIFLKLTILFDLQLYQ